MLREELRDEDIPKRTHIRKRVLEIWNDHIEELAKEMKVSQISGHRFIGLMNIL
jgi:hypothetical protein